MSDNYKDKKWLQEMYVEKHLSQTEIARICGVSQATISRYLQKFNIKQPHHDEEWLRDRYIGDRMSMTDIAELCGVTPRAISYRIEESDIESEGIKGDRNPMYRTSS